MSLTTLMSLLMIGLMLAAAIPAGAADNPASPGLDEKSEKELADRIGELVELAKPDAPDTAKLLEKIRLARKQVAGLLTQADPATPAEPDAVKLPPEAPVVLLGDSTAEQVRRLWIEQIRVNLNAAAGILAGQSGLINEWVSWPNLNRQTGRLPTIAETLREAEKGATLLSAKPQPIKVRRGEQLLADDFAKGADKWLIFGPHKAVNEGDAFRFTDTTPNHPDAMMWTKQDFQGNFVAEFTFIPHSAGARPGALFTVCGRPRPGKELAVCVGESMNTYNFGIDGYHFSMHRGNTGLGNGRRVGQGLKMLASGPDPAPTIGQAYRVAVAKWDNVLVLMVDGKLIHNYLDGETFGPVLREGKIGLRHWAGMDASYRDFRVHRLVADGPTTAPELIEPKGRLLFEETFKDLANWRPEGGGTVALDGELANTMRVECVGSSQGKVGAQAFCLKDFPDGVAVEYDLKVLTSNGLVITFVALRGAKGEDLFDPSLPKRTGVFGDYVRSEALVSYHVSVSRYGDKGEHTGVSNWRRNPGLNLMKEGPDLCKEINRWYRIRIVKDGRHCQLGVDGKLAHEFTDPGELPAPLPAGGKVGFRAIGSDVRMLVRNFKVTALR